MCVSVCVCLLAGRGFKISSPVAKRAKMAGMPMGSAEVRDVVKKLCAKEELSGE